jgi:hypothetical protein
LSSGGFCSASASTFKRQLGTILTFSSTPAEETMRQHRRTSLGVLTERAELLFLATQLWILIAQYDIIAQYGLNIARRELSC